MSPRNRTPYFGWVRKMYRRPETVDNLRERERERERGASFTLRFTVGLYPHQKIAIPGPLDVFNINWLFDCKNFDRRSLHPYRKSNTDWTSFRRFVQDELLANQYIWKSQNVQCEGLMSQLCVNLYFDNSDSDNPIWRWIARSGFVIFTTVLKNAMRDSAHKYQNNDAHKY